MAKEKAPAFMFNASEWLSCERVLILTYHQRGRLFTQLCEAAIAGDQDAFARLGWPFASKLRWHRVILRPHIPQAVKNAVFSFFGRICRECSSTTRVEIDHVVPVSKGGSSDPGNLQPLCKTCNCRKGAKY